MRLEKSKRYRMKIKNTTGIGKDTSVILISPDGNEMDISSSVIGSIHWDTHAEGLAAATITIRLAKIDVEVIA